MKIAILETIHEDGISILQKIAQVDRLEGISRQELLARVSDYDGIVIKSNILVDSEVIQAATKLKVVARAGVGVDNIDRELLKAKSIPLITTPTGNTISTAEYTISMILNLVRRMPEINLAVSNGDYRRHLLEGLELSQMTVGIFGIGNTGMTVAKRLAGFGCSLIGCDRTLRRKTIFADLGGEMVETLDEMIERIDILTLHVPSTPQTFQIINKKIFDRMRKGSYLINTSRGNNIHENDLIDALDNSTIAGAALDVISPEPSYNTPPQGYDFSHPLITHPNVIYTPHIAASTKHAQVRIAIQLASQIAKVLR